MQLKDQIRRNWKVVAAVTTVATSPDGTVVLANAQLDATYEEVPASTIESLM